MTKADGAVVVDARGMRCPWPALRLARALRVSNSAILIADDPNVASELAALADQHGWHVEFGDAGSGEKGWRVSRA